jgi:hypothetical protein
MNLLLKILLTALATVATLVLLFACGDTSVESGPVDSAVESAVEFDQDPDSIKLFADGPLHASVDLRAVGIYELPGQIEDPSAIAHSADKLYVSTHQGKLFVLTHTYDLLAQPSLQAGPVPLGSGSLEGITLTEYGLWGVGKQGVTGHWRPDDWQRLAEQPLSDATNGLIFTGVTVHDAEILATFTPLPDAPIAVANLSRGTITPLRFGPFLKQGHRANELDLSGIASDGVNLFAITSNYPSIIVIDPATMTAIDVAQLDPLTASGISVRDKRVYATAARDNSGQPASIYVYDLGKIIR